MSVLFDMIVFLVVTVAHIVISSFALIIAINTGAFWRTLFHNVFGFNAMTTSVNQGKSFFKILLIDRVQVFGL